MERASLCLSQALGEGNNGLPWEDGRTPATTGAGPLPEMRAGSGVDGDVHVARVEEAALAAGRALAREHLRLDGAAHP